MTYHLSPPEAYTKHSAWNVFMLYSFIIQAHGFVIACELVLPFEWVFVSAQYANHETCVRPIAMF